MKKYLFFLTTILSILISTNNIYAINYTTDEEYIEFYNSQISELENYFEEANVADVMGVYKYKKYLKTKGNENYINNIGFVTNKNTATKAKGRIEGSIDNTIKAGIKKIISESVKRTITANSIGNAYSKYLLEGLTVADLGVNKINNSDNYKYLQYKAIEVSSHNLTLLQEIYFYSNFMNNEAFSGVVFNNITTDPAFVSLYECYLTSRTIKDGKNCLRDFMYLSGKGELYSQIQNINRTSFRQFEDINLYLGSVPITIKNNKFYFDEKSCKSLTNSNKTGHIIKNKEVKQIYTLTDEVKGFDGKRFRDLFVYDLKYTFITKEGFLILPSGKLSDTKAIYDKNKIYMTKCIK